MVGDRGSKNYQLWQHRRVVAEWLARGGAGREGGADAPPIAAGAAAAAAAEEAAFTARYIAEDAKNYHAWSHRQWAVRTFGGWAGEAEFTEAALFGAAAEGEEGAGGASGGVTAAGPDVRNNSAWSHRWFVLTRGGGLPARVAAAAAGAAAAGAPPPCPLAHPATAAAEVALALSALKAVSKNESAWSYLRALVAASGAGIAGWPATTAAAGALAAVAAPRVHVFASEWLAEAAEERARVAGGEGAREAELATAVALYVACAGADPVRARYWRGRAVGVREG
jgi:protein farnesyltransferase/geranylgeranyltransferase type-1 subunit alpha